MKKTRETFAGCIIRRATEQDISYSVCSFRKRSEHGAVKNLDSWKRDNSCLQWQKPLFLSKDVLDGT